MKVPLTLLNYCYNKIHGYNWHINVTSYVVPYTHAVIVVGGDDNDDDDADDDEGSGGAGDICEVVFKFFDKPSLSLTLIRHNGEEIANEKSITPLMKAEIIKKDHNDEEDFDELEDEDVDEDLLSLDSYYSDIIDEKINLKCSSKSNKRITIEITVLGVIYELVTTLRGALHLSLGSRFAMATHIVAQQPNNVSKTQNSNQHQPVSYSAANNRSSNIQSDRQ
uniref:Uncharacterized protein n=1 Tax=Glossina palpalis gambiensis TaxID=67801 RepID=A0A1B0BLN2_9MUSC